MNPITFLNDIIIQGFKDFGALIRRKEEGPGKQGHALSGYFNKPRAVHLIHNVDTV